MAHDGILETGFNGLSAAQPALPAAWYYEPAHFAREMRDIWRQRWVYLCRADTLAGPGAFRTFTVAGQEVLVVRDRSGALQGFFNTCRHRGSVLCTDHAGTLDGRITCPYHQWTFGLDGRLLATGVMRKVEGFDRAEHGLHPVGVAEWRGFVFVHLSPGEAPPFEAVHGAELSHVAAWPVEELVTGHSWRKQIACNWKIFWENYNECLHCPNIHPELSQLVPIYGRGIMEGRDDPDWQASAGEDDPRRAGGLRQGAQTWSMDGKAVDAFPELGAAERASGQRFTTLLPSVFMSAHLDHMRVVRVTPLGPERTELNAEWLFRKSVVEDGSVDLSGITTFSKLVLEQDSAACELNQRGMTSAPFERGVLMQEEYDVFLFQEWIRAALGEPRLAG